jgi:ComF family protein
MWLNINHMLNIAKISNRILPQNCLLCKQEDHGLAICSACLADLPWQVENCCQLCGLISNNPICGRCLKQAPAFNHTYAVFQYAYPIDALIPYYKYHHALHLCQTLGELLAQKLITQNIDYLIAMPMHPYRIRERGFNQSLELAKVVSRITNIPLHAFSCQRIKHTPPQASLAHKDRIKNVKDVFACSQDYTGKRIAMIDDVMTTGASLNELAKTIKKAGAREVSCCVLARTL